MSERDELIAYLSVCSACHGCGIGADGDTCTNCDDRRQPNRRAADLLERDGARIAELEAENARLHRVGLDDEDRLNEARAALTEARSERQREHDLRCRLAGELETAQEVLAKWQDASQCGHPAPCTLGPLCPYCEIGRLREAVKRQASAAITLADATKAISGHDLETAQKLRAESQPGLIESERAANARLTAELDEARAALAEAQRDAGRYRWLVNAGSENSPIARAQAVYRLWNGEDGTDGFTRALDAAIAKEQSHASE